MRLGGEASLVSRIGDDLPGRAIIADLDAEGIDTLGVHVLPQGRTSLSSVIIDGAGERLVVNDTDMAVLTGTEGGGADAVRRGGRRCSPDTRWADAATVAMQQAASLGVPGVLDFDRVPDAAGWEPLLELAPYILFGRQGLAHFTGCEAIEDGLRAARGRTTAWLGVTAGEQGVYWLDHDAVRHMPAFEVKTVDTLGGGRRVPRCPSPLALAENRTDRGPPCASPAPRPPLNAPGPAAAAARPGPRRSRAFLEEPA